MQLNQITGNILNKFNDQRINILYEPQNNLFDVILSHCDINLIAQKQNFPFINLKDSNLCLVDNEQFNMFNYNVGITNNILQYSANKKFDILHLNSIIFTHSFRPASIKKEDVVLLDNNLFKSKKVFFDHSTAASWKMFNSSVFNYGIPLDKFYNKNNTRNNKVLIFNLQNNPNVETLAQFLSNYNIQVDILNKLNFNITDIMELLNQYPICIDINDFNIINLLSAIACGCKTITYATPMIETEYYDLPNLHITKTVQDLISTINYLISSPYVECLSYLEKTYAFDSFQSNINNLIEISNKEAFII